MAGLEVQVDPAAVGFDRKRLERIDNHFRRYVDDGRLPGWLVAVARHGKVAHLSTYGHRDVEVDLPIELDTLFRIYSMTKPITSVAAMMLAEEGAFELKDPVARYLPEFASQRVYVSGPAERPRTEPILEPMQIWHLLTHTSGLSYGFHHVHPVDAMYRIAGFEWGSPAGLDTAACCRRFAEIPLQFQPGSGWCYGVSTDVLGRLLEVVSGQTLEELFVKRIFGPLGMHDTGFAVGDADRHRLAALYMASPNDGRRVRSDELGVVPAESPPYLSGGAGLCSTAADYLRFANMLRRGGELDGQRLLSPRTVRWMTSNHLPGGVDLEAMGQIGFAETVMAGVGFGLGFGVVIDPIAQRSPCSLGDFAWGGAASTAFWIDPVEDVTVVFLTQLLPSSVHPIRPQLKALVHQALVD